MTHPCIVTMVRNLLEQDAAKTFAYRVEWLRALQRVAGIGLRHSGGKQYRLPDVG
jgi:hypothetical protein